MIKDIVKIDAAVRMAYLLRDAELYIAIGRYHLKFYIEDTSVDFDKEDFFSGIDAVVDILSEVTALADYCKD